MAAKTLGHVRWTDERRRWWDEAAREFKIDLLEPGASPSLLRDLSGLRSNVTKHGRGRLKHINASRESRYRNVACRRNYPLGLEGWRSFWVAEIESRLAPPTTASLNEFGKWTGVSWNDLDLWFSVNSAGRLREHGYRDRIHCFLTRDVSWPWYTFHVLRWKVGKRTDF